MPKRRVVRHEVAQPLDQSYKLIPLTQGQNAIVDTEDFQFINQWNWYAHWSSCTNSFYAVRHEHGSKKFINMANAVKCMEFVIDHINRDTLDNRKHNLRKCTHGQNVRNKGRYRNSTSGFKGVFWNRGKWTSCIHSNGKRIYLGRFADRNIAAKVYDLAAMKFHGKFAVLNFPKH